MAPRWRPRHTMYLVASLSAWGDRMWTFAVGLYMVYATPDSLRLTAIYGLVISTSVIALGASVGRWVDTTARLRAAQLSLLVQNCAVCCCAVLLMVGLQYAEYTASTWRGWLQILLQVLVILIADVAALASEANKITIQKDWVVVMAQGDQDTLAWMNSAFRTIDLGTYILAPVLVGQLMTFLSPVAAAGFMAGWNVLSLVVEYWLLRRVYSGVPQLARPKRPDSPDQSPAAEKGAHITAAADGTTEPAAPAEPPPSDDQRGPTADGELGQTADGQRGPTADTSLLPSVLRPRSPSVSASAPAGGCCGWLRVRLADLRRGWTVYFHSDFCLAGLALASLYMTVLGFDNITAGYGYSQILALFTPRPQGYGYTQGLTESTLSLLTGAGAFTGILGSLCYPKLRRSLGPTVSYYPKLRRSLGPTWGRYPKLRRSLGPTVSYYPKLRHPVSYYPKLRRSLGPTVSYCPKLRRSLGPTVSYCPKLRRSLGPTVSYYPKLRRSLGPTVSYYPKLRRSLGPTVSYYPKLRRSLGPTRAGVVGFSLAVLAQSLSLTSVFLPGTAFWPLAEPDSEARTSVITLFCGIILARFGLWISDLSVTQLLQERVPEWRRGAVSGVQSSLNMTMDTAKCLLVVGVPRASHFGLLIILSYLFWIIGWCFFTAYALTAGRRPAAAAVNGSAAVPAEVAAEPAEVPVSQPPTELLPADGSPLLGGSPQPAAEVAENGADLKV
ncbi:Solute carrier family 40 member 1 [Amphibalanus amphitrite]|uniref:Solute carrier family 40 member 1 n=1 Tax=Amphibalanus amphitrite TaxID=1232801 RepID=A0A6A4VEA1_AMPAM|nr:Solute carrier family 40 member 1 [Amphibalanus amphitrite]